MDRTITPNEAAVVRWLLEHAAIGDVAAYRQCVLRELRVVGGCDCGCSSLYFPDDTKGHRMIADAMAVYPDRQEANLMLWGNGDAIVWLEISDLGPGTPGRFPEVSNLRTYEDLGRELLSR